MPLQAIPTGIATGVGSTFRKEVVQSIAPGVRFVFPVGCFYAYAFGADVRIQVQDSAGLWNNLAPAGENPDGVVFSDGVNFAAINNGVGAETLTYIQIG